MLSLGELFASWVFLSIAERELKKISRKMEREEKYEVKKQERTLAKAYKKCVNALEKYQSKN